MCRTRGNLAFAFVMLTTATFTACDGSSPGGGANGGAASGGTGADGGTECGAAGANGGAASGAAGADGGTGCGDGSVLPTATCRVGETAALQAPEFVRNIPAGETAWFASPAVLDLSGDGKKEIVAPLYSTFVFDAQGRRLAKGTATEGRVYASPVVADLDKDGAVDIVVGGNKGTVAAYSYSGGALTTKWIASTCSGTPTPQCPEARGLAGGDLDGDGTIELVVTTTQTLASGAQVFVFSANGQPYAPPRISWTAWPRYNTASGTGNDADFNGMGNHGYGCYGQNVGIGNIDDDPQLEIIVTYDNHQINAFNYDGTSTLASDWYTNRATQYQGRRFGWGQFIRWFDPDVEDNHYHAHTGPWPSPTTSMWLQWTASPPNVVDMDGDGKNEVVGFPNAELHDPYETQGYALMVLDGAYGAGARSARRHAGFEHLPLSDKPPVRPDGDWYPPDGMPAPTTVSIVGDARPEIIAPLNDGYIYAFGPDGKRLWRFDYRRSVPKTFASEVIVADLNKDGAPELIFGTYGLDANAGRIVVLSNTGALLFNVTLPGQGTNGNGIGVPAAPTVADLDGDGALEIVVATFDHGIDVFTVPGSGDNCLLWPTGRGGYLRSGAGPATAR